MEEANKMAQDAIENCKTIETKLYEAFVCCLKLMQETITVSCRIVCNNTLKFDLVMNAICNFLNECLKKQDKDRE